MSGPGDIGCLVLRWAGFGAGDIGCLVTVTSSVLRAVSRNRYVTANGGDCSAVQCSAVQCIAVQFSAVELCADLSNTV